MSATKTRTPIEVLDADLELPEAPTQSPVERHIADVWFDKTIPLSDRLAFRNEWNACQPYTRPAGLNQQGYQMWQTARNRNRFCDMLVDAPGKFGGSGRIYSWDAPRQVTYMVGDEERIGYVMDVYDLGLNAAEPMQRVGVVQRRDRIVLDDGSVAYHERPFTNDGEPYRAVYAWLQDYCQARAQAFADSEAGAAQRAKMDAYAQAQFAANNPAALARADAQRRYNELTALKATILATPEGAHRDKLIAQFRLDKAAYDEAKAIVARRGDQTPTAF